MLVLSSSQFDPYRKSPRPMNRRLPSSKILDALAASCLASNQMICSLMQKRSQRGVVGIGFVVGLAVESIRHRLSVGPERDQRAGLIEDEFGKEAAVAAFDVDDRFQFVIQLLGLNVGARQHGQYGFKVSHRRLGRWSRTRPIARQRRWSRAKPRRHEGFARSTETNK